MKKVLFTLILFNITLFSAGLSECKHLLSRTMFGADKTNLHKCLKANNYNFFVQQMLSHTASTSDSIYQDDYRPQIIRPSKKIQLMSIQKRKAFQKQKRESYMELKQWWFNTMLLTSTPFLERMVLFWHNHFTSSLLKVGQAALLYNQNELFRQHAMGNFATLLHAIVEDPAMLIYLDNRANRKGHPNENFARELLELFTMGEGHYSEKDIQELARALTGYSVGKDFTFRFKKQIHDKGSKEIFNQKGYFNAHDAINIILEQPATSKFMVTKLWLEFISPNPNPDEVQRLAILFKEHNYEMKPLLKALFLTKAFTNPANYGIMIKSPAELVIGTLRTFGLKNFDTKTGVQFCTRLGQNLFTPPNVKGWGGDKLWINTHTLLIRRLFLNRLLRGDTIKAASNTFFKPNLSLKMSKEEYAAQILLPIAVFITPGKQFKDTLKTMLLSPLYQLK